MSNRRHIHIYIYIYLNISAGARRRKRRRGASTTHREVVDRERAERRGRARRSERGDVRPRVAAARRGRADRGRRDDDDERQHELGAQSAACDRYSYWFIIRRPIRMRHVNYDRARRRAAITTQFSRRLCPLCYISWPHPLGSARDEKRCSARRRAPPRCRAAITSYFYAGCPLCDCGVTPASFWYFILGGNPRRSPTGQARGKQRAPRRRAAG